MSTSISSITPQTAPRDVESLMKAGIFQLRLLVDNLYKSLGSPQTEEQKISFSKMSPEGKAKAAKELLDAWDRANPGAAAMAQQPQQPQQQMAPPPMQMAAPPQMAVPSGAQVPYANGTVNGNGAYPNPAIGAAPMPFHPQQPPMQQMQMPMGPPPQVAQVDPAALAHAQQAAGATAPAATTRKPRNSAAKAESQEEGPGLGPQILAMLTQLGEQSQKNTETVVGVLRQVNESLEGLNKGGTDDEVKKHLSSLNASYAGVYNVLTSWDSRLTQIQFSANLSIALSLFLAEQVIQGAGRQDVLQMALGDMSGIMQMVQATANPGKG